MNKKAELLGMATIFGFIVIFFVGMVVFQQVFSTAQGLDTNLAAVNTTDTILANNATVTSLSFTPRTLTNVTAKNRTWLDFDGIDDRVTIHNNFGTDSPELEMDGRNFTVSLWINLSGRGDFGTPINYTLMFTKDSIGSFGYGLIRGDGNGERGINRTCFYSNTNRTCSLVNMTWGVWHNVIGNFNGTFCNLYVNGTYKSSTACSNPGDAGSFSMLLGAAGTTRNPNMSMDELRLYNRSLTQQEITNVYGSGRITNSSLPNDGLVLWQPINENTGTTTYDISEQGISSNGTISGATYLNDTADILLTENTDYTRTGNNITITNDLYSWSELKARYSYDTTTSSATTTILRLTGIFIALIFIVFLAAGVMKGANEWK